MLLQHAWWLVPCLLFAAAALSASRFWRWLDVNHRRLWYQSPPRPRGSLSESQSEDSIIL
jgi:hypothetical protein